MAFARSRDKAAVGFLRELGCGAFRVLAISHSKGRSGSACHCPACSPMPTGSIPRSLDSWSSGGQGAARSVGGVLPAGYPRCQVSDTCAAAASGWLSTGVMFVLSYKSKARPARARIPWAVAHALPGRHAYDSLLLPFRRQHCPLCSLSNLATHPRDDMSQGATFTDERRGFL